MKYRLFEYPMPAPPEVAQTALSAVSQVANLGRCDRLGSILLIWTAVRRRLALPTGSRRYSRLGSLRYGGDRGVCFRPTPLPMGAGLIAVMGKKVQACWVRWVGRNVRPHPNPLPLGRGRVFGCVIRSAGASGGRVIGRANGPCTVKPREARELSEDARSGSLPLGERIPPTSNFVLLTPEPRKEIAFRDLDHALDLDRFPDFSRLGFMGRAWVRASVHSRCP